MYEAPIKIAIVYKSPLGNVCLATDHPLLASSKAEYRRVLNTVLDVTNTIRTYLISI